MSNKKDEELANRVSCAATIIKDTLECFNLYVGVDAKTEEFIFVDRENYPQSKFARVPMKEINLKND